MLGLDVEAPKVNSGEKRVFTRNGLDWAKRFSTIAGAFNLPGEAIIDEAVVVIHEGRTSFSELQAELATGRQGRMVYYAFDLLWRDGDMRNRCAQHRAMWDYWPYTRSGARVTVKGERPV